MSLLTIIIKEIFIFTVNNFDGMKRHIHRNQALQIIHHLGDIIIIVIITVITIVIITVIITIIIIIADITATTSTIIIIITI